MKCPKCLEEGVFCAHCADQEVESITRRTNVHSPTPILARPLSSMWSRLYSYWFG